jgi:protein gp37
VNKTSIEWTDFSANPLRYKDARGRAVWSCVKVSPGCANCYSEAQAHRYRRGGSFTAKVMAGLTAFLDPAELRKMLTYKPASGKLCFVGDMTDVFGPWVSDELLDQLFATMAMRRDVTWQVLTKRPERMRDYFRTIQDEDKDLQRLANQAAAVAGSPCAAGIFDKTDWPLPNVWLGVSVEDQQHADERIHHLLRTPAAVRFLSCEPLLGPIRLPVGDDVELSERRAMHKEGRGMGGLGESIDWVIAGGESGPNARPCNISWVRSIIEQCRAAGVACFVKQLGSNPRPDAKPSSVAVRFVRDRKGSEPAEWPADLRVRQFPEVAGT